MLRLVRAGCIRIAPSLSLSLSFYPLLFTHYLPEWHLIYLFVPSLRQSSLTDKLGSENPSNPSTALSSLLIFCFFFSTSFIIISCQSTRTKHLKAKKRWLWNAIAGKQLTDWPPSSLHTQSEQTKRISNLARARFQAYLSGHRLANLLCPALGCRSSKSLSF